MPFPPLTNLFQGSKPTLQDLLPHLLILSLLFLALVLPLIPLYRRAFNNTHNPHQHELHIHALQHAHRAQAVLRREIFRLRRQVQLLSADTQRLRVLRGDEFPEPLEMRGPRGVEVRQERGYGGYAGSGGGYSYGAGGYPRDASEERGRGEEGAGNTTVRFDKVKNFVVMRDGVVLCGGDNVDRVRVDLDDDAVSDEGDGVRVRGVGNIRGEENGHGQENAHAANPIGENGVDHANGHGVGGRGGIVNITPNFLGPGMFDFYDSDEDEDISRRAQPGSSMGENGKDAYGYGYGFERRRGEDDDPTDRPRPSNNLPPNAHNTHRPNEPYPTYSTRPRPSNNHPLNAHNTHRPNERYPRTPSRPEIRRGGITFHPSEEARPRPPNVAFFTNTRRPTEHVHAPSTGNPAYPDIPIQSPHRNLDPRHYYDHRQAACSLSNSTLPWSGSHGGPSNSTQIPNSDPAHRHTHTNLRMYPQQYTHLHHPPYRNHHHGVGLDEYEMAQRHPYGAHRHGRTYIVGGEGERMFRWVSREQELQPSEQQERVRQHLRQPETIVEVGQGDQRGHWVSRERELQQRLDQQEQQQQQPPRHATSRNSNGHLHRDSIADHRQWQQRRQHPQRPPRPIALTPFLEEQIERCFDDIAHELFWGRKAHIPDFAVDAFCGINTIDDPLREQAHARIAAMTPAEREDEMQRIRDYFTFLDAGRGISELLGCGVRFEGLFDEDDTDDTKAGSVDGFGKREHEVWPYYARGGGGDQVGEPTAFKGKGKGKAKAEDVDTTDEAELEKRKSPAREPSMTRRSDGNLERENTVKDAPTYATASQLGLDNQQRLPPFDTPGSATNPRLPPISSRATRDSPFPHLTPPPLPARRQSGPQAPKQGGNGEQDKGPSQSRFAASTPPNKCRCPPSLGEVSDSPPTPPSSFRFYSSGVDAGLRPQRRGTVSTPDPESPFPCRYFGRAGDTHLSSPPHVTSSSGLGQVEMGGGSQNGQPHHYNSTMAAHPEGTAEQRITEFEVTPSQATTRAVNEPSTQNSTSEDSRPGRIRIDLKKQWHVPPSPRGEDETGEVENQPTEDSDKDEGRPRRHHYRHYHYHYHYDAHHWQRLGSEHLPVPGTTDTTRPTSFPPPSPPTQSPLPKQQSQTLASAAYNPETPPNKSTPPGTGSPGLMPAEWSHWAPRSPSR